METNYDSGSLLPGKSPGNGSPDAGPVTVAQLDTGHNLSAHATDTKASLLNHPSREHTAEQFSFLTPGEKSAELGWLNHYRVEKLLGQGAMGFVFLAEDTHLQRRVAIKVMRPQIAEHPDARQRFLREARATATIRSEHVATIYEIGQVNDLPYLVSELLSGATLDAWLRENPSPSMDTITSLSLQLAEGLEAAHKAGVIHRDIKPSNIWVEPGGRVKLLDFGLAHTHQEAANLTQAGAVLGTPAYMAPEQAEGKPIDARCDLFSLGCVYYEIATGTRAFSGPTVVATLSAILNVTPRPVAELSPGVTPAYAELVTQLLAKDPNNRPASASEIVSALTSSAARIPSPVPARQGLRALLRGSRNLLPRRRGALIALGLCLIAPVLVALLWRSHDVSGFSEPVQGVTDNEIVVGMTAPFSGPSRELGRQMETGIRTCFNAVNESNGVLGRKLKLIALDDGYKPDRALANMEELYDQHRVFAVLGNVGTPTAEKTMPYALSKRMVFFGAFTGAAVLRRDPPDRYVFNYRASYVEETVAIVKYMTEVRGFKPHEIAVFAQADGYGDAGFVGVAKALRKYGVQAGDILRVSHARNSDDVAEAVDAVLKRPTIRGVVMVTTYRPAAQFIRRIKDAKADMLFANVSFVGPGPLAEELRQLGSDYVDGVIVTQVVPHPAALASAAIKYRNLMRKYYPNETPDFGSFEGYIGATLFIEGLARTGRNLTNETFVEALEAITNLDIGLGAPLTLRPSEHQASHKVWGTVLDRAGNYQALDLD